MVTTEDATEMIGGAVFDREHDRIGEVRQVYLDAESDEPTWVGVRTGLFGSDVLVPLDGADWQAPALLTAVERSTVRSAPPVDVDDPISPDEQEALRRHYGIPGARSPRSDVDLEAICGSPLSYSVHDDGMDEHGEHDDAAEDRDAGEGRGGGSAMEQAAEQRSAAVSGRMLDRAPEALGGRG